MESKSRIWPSLGCCRSHKRGRSCGRLWFNGVLDPVLYVPAILGLWVLGLFGTYSSYTLCCGIKSSVYGQVRGALVPTNEGVPVADYDFMAVWSLYCMYQPCWVCGSKGYLVHTAHIPPLWNEKSRIWPSFGCPRSHNGGRPCGRLGFYGSLDAKLYVPAILGPWVQGLFGTYSSYTRLNVESKAHIWPSLGSCRSHKRGRPCGRLWLDGSLDPVLYVPAIFGKWV